MDVAADASVSEAVRQFSRLKSSLLSEVRRKMSPNTLATSMNRSRRVWSRSCSARADYAYDAFSDRIFECSLAELEMLAMLTENENTGCANDAAGDISLPLGQFAKSLEADQIFQPIRLRDVDASIDSLRVQHALTHHLQALQLEVTRRCSLRCEYCVFSGKYGDSRTHSDEDMSLETATRAVDFFLDHVDHTRSPLSFSFYGGEPLLKAALLLRIIDYIETQIARDRFSVHLTTNGIGLASRKLRSELSERAVSLTVSVDGPKSVHDRFRRTRADSGSYSTIEANLEALRREHPGYYRTHVGFNAVVTPPFEVTKISEHFSAWPLFEASSRRLRINKVRTFSTSAFDASLDEERCLAARKEEREEFVARRCSEAVPRDGLAPDLELLHIRLASRKRGVPLPSSVVPTGYCIPGARKLFVTVSGKFGVCEKVNDRIMIGDLDKGFDFESIQSTLSGLTAMWRPECSWCVAQRYCGVCVDQVDRNGIMDARRFASVCRATRNTFLDGVRSFIEVCERNPVYAESLSAIELT